LLSLLVVFKRNTANELSWLEGGVPLDGIASCYGKKLGGKVVPSESNELRS
jgi:hypothetical protein